MNLASLLFWYSLSVEDQRTCGIDASVEWGHCKNQTEGGGGGMGKWRRKGRRVGVISNLATARRTCGSCSHLLRASTLLVFRCGRLSIKIASAQRIPEAGHSCMAERKANIHFQKLWSWQFHELAFLARDVVAVWYKNRRQKRQRTNIPR